MAACLIQCGFAVGDHDKFTYGMLINFLCEHDRMQRRAHGEKIRDPEEYYQRLKKLQPIIMSKLEKGEITPEKYAEWVIPIRQYEGW